MNKDMKTIIIDGKPLSISLISQDEVNKYEKEINDILMILGHPEALVTDESTIQDFMTDTSYLDEEDKILELTFQNEILDDLSEYVNYKVHGFETLVSLAKHANECIVQFDLDFGSIPDTTSVEVMEAGQILQSAQHNDEC